MTDLLVIDNLHARYESGKTVFGRSRYREILHGVSFSVGKGETFGLVGESGSGKSTIGRAILRLVPTSGGSISFAGTDIDSWGRSTPRAYRRAVQVVFQNPLASLNPRMLIREILEEAVTFHLQLRGAELRGRVTELLDDVNLAGSLADRYPHELSGGQQQRVAIARALVPSPELVICDEAVSALDVTTQFQVLELLRRLQHERGLSYLFISHDLGVVRSLSHRVGVLSGGDLVEVGDSSEVYSNPKHPYTRELLAAVPRIDVSSF